MKILSLIFILISFSVTGQVLPDSIVIVRNHYVARYENKDSVYSYRKFIITHNDKKYELNGKRIKKATVLDLITEINNKENTNNSIAKYGLDTTFIKQHSEELISLYSKTDRLEWNEQQKEFICRKLSNFELYQEFLKDYQSNGGYYTMHNSYKDEYIINVYLEGVKINEVKSRKFVWGYKLPWINQNGDTLYNYNIERILEKFIPMTKKIKSPLKGDALQKYLVNKIIDNNMRFLYKLTPYSYLKEIEELKSDFKVISFEEVYGRGRYIWNEPKTIKISLKNEDMLPNVYLQFLASEVDRTIYSRDSIKKDYKNIINRIQSIPFIIDFLKRDTSTALDIYYFNNNGINQYNIDAINKNPAEWKKQEAYIESLKWYEKSNIKPSFDIHESIKTSELNNCGCNYRFKNDFIEKAIFFEIKSLNNSSIWFLLPDNTLLLYHEGSYRMESSKVLDKPLTNYVTNASLPFACLLFDKNGELILRK